MEQIQEIHIENFQSHTKTTVQPAPNGELTVLTGQSDSGKTAILRALRWVFYNSPSNTDFIRVGATFARVTVGFTDGTTVTRWRSTGGINRYLVNGETLEGFGTGVPLEVIEATGVKELTIGDLSFNLNLAEQLDGPFLGKSVSAPARAKVLGKLAGTEEIDFAGKMLGTDLYRRNQDEKRVASELKTIDVKLSEYFYLPSLQEKIIKLEEVVAKVKELQEKRDKLAQLRDKYQSTNIIINEVKQVINRYQNIDLIELMVIKTETNKTKHEQLIKNKVKLSALNDGIKQAQLAIKSVVNLEIIEIMMSNAECFHKKKDQLLTEKARLFNLNESINQARDIIKFNQNIEPVEKILINVAGKITTKQSLDRLNAKLKELNLSIYNEQRTLNRLPDIDQLSLLINKIPELNIKKNRLGDKLVLLGTCASQIKYHTGIINQLKNISQAENIISLLSEYAQKVEALGKWQFILTKTETVITQEKEFLVIWEQKVAELEGVYRDELVTLGKCPTCGNENINPDELKEVI